MLSKRWAFLAVVIMLSFWMISTVFTFSVAMAQEGEKEATSSRVSLNFKDVDIQEVLGLIAEKGNLNIIAGEEVKGKITLSLKEVKLWDALEAILDMYGFTYQEKKGIIKVFKGEKVKASPPVTVKLESKVISLKYVQAEEIKGLLEHLLSSSGLIEVDKRINVLVVTDTLDNIEEIEQLAKQLDVRVPHFTLTGILLGSDYSLAVINDNIVREGDEIDGFRVKKVGEKMVILKGEHQEITLSLGGEK